MNRYTLLGALVVAASALAAPLKTDPAKSQVSATFKEQGVPVEARFKRFAASIDYDAAKPEAAKASIDIEIASIDVGEAEINKEAQKPEWFNAAKYPKASFVSSAIKPAGAGKLQVSGKLSIKGLVQDVSFPLTLKTEGNNQVFEGSLPIKRLAFNVGEGAWKDTSMVADEVVIKFRLTAGK
ncbi:YceI family protein [Massilia sp. TS11]|uniref:YceI family protein n=1 Tax=Massilia sp. TS11 TaxID=2908003 RepID=UPI001EDC8F40|nr:YceI family protein [Massilia sp. TS11]MCG2586690.1 YceI family protein [Massilia sp. TS11]